MKKYLLLTLSSSFFLILIPIIVVVVYISQGQSDAFQTITTDTCGTSCNTAKIVPRNGQNSTVKTYSTAQKTITVDKSIAPNLQRLLDAANKDGIKLGGWGYRSNARQISLRKKHCGGTSNYAVYQKPSGSCNPPTARPGASQHEKGLAIDFTCNGGSIRRSSKCYRWLNANAHKYGLKNLPSEPWHWSTTGR